MVFVTWSVEQRQNFKKESHSNYRACKVLTEMDPVFGTMG
jgi:hypothetical protein